MKNSVLKDFDPSKAALIIGVALLCAVEMLIVCGVISSYLPYKTDPALQEIFFHYRKGYMPERELQLYALGIFWAAAFFFIIILALRRYLTQESFLKSLARYGFLHLFIVTIEIAIVFSVIVNVESSIVKIGLYGFLGLSVIIKIFFSEINSWLGRKF